MEIYKLSFQDTFLGTLTVDTDTGMSTLSPKDPNFPAWWEKHKSEWEA